MPGNRKGRPRNVDRVATVYPVGRRKVCSGPCGLEKPWSAFYVKERWPDGVVKAVRSKCKLCESQIARDRWEEYAAADRTQLNAERRAYHHRRMMTDREYAERVRKTARENNRLRYATDPEFRRKVIERSLAFNRSPRGRALERRRRRRAQRERQRERSMRLPAAPWREWLQEERARFPETQEMASWLGVDESGLRRWLDGTTGVRLDVADAVLCRIEQPHLLLLLWPELYENPNEEAA